MTIPGVGPLLLLYLVRTLGPVEPFAGMRCPHSCPADDCSVTHCLGGRNGEDRVKTGVSQFSQLVPRLRRWDCHLIQSRLRLCCRAAEAEVVAGVG